MPADGRAAVMEIVSGGGFRLLTSDLIVIALVRRCAALEAELAVARAHRDTARYRTIRRDVTQIKRAVERFSAELNGAIAAARGEIGV